MQIQYFKDLPLSPEVMKGIEELGFSSLFPIQAQAIMPLLEGKNVIGQAQTGTGKTAAFGIPMVERLNPKINSVQGLILEPTRELAIQVAEHISQLSKYAAFKALPIYGGEPIPKQIHALESGVHIVVGTPGRTIDHLKRGTLNLASVKTKVACCNGCCCKRPGHSRNNPHNKHDIPLDALVYFHRIGRTARMGREGTAITLVGYGELTQFNNIKTLTKTAIDELEYSPFSKS